MLIDNPSLNFHITDKYSLKLESRSQNVLTTFAWSMTLISPSFCDAALSSDVIYSKDNRFQVKVGTFAQNKSSSTLLEEN